MVRTALDHVSIKVHLQVCPLPTFLEQMEEQKLKELIYLFGHPLAGNIKMKTSQRKTVSVWVICGTEK